MSFSRPALALTLILALTTTTLGQAAPFSFVAIGDIPYNDEQIARFTQSLKHISAMDAAFVLHVGDIKSSKEPCDESVYAHRANLYNQSALPFILLVGDNEFNDCDDPTAAIGHFRQYFCADGNSLGQRRIPLERQPAIQPEHAYPEHVRWAHEGIHFLGLNVVGSDNNLGNPEEWKARTDAGLAWLKRGFEQAKAENAAALVVAIHANPFGDAPYPESYAPIMTTLEAEAKAFGKPVLFMHGDTHYFRWDIPFKGDRGASTNLSRLEVFGSPNPHWVEVMVDPTSPDVFAIRPHFLRD